MRSTRVSSRLVKHQAGVIALSDAGAHLVYLCDAGFGLYLLGHWVRERGAFDLAEGVRRLTSHQAGLYGIPDRGRIEIGAYADLLLFDPATVGVSPARRVNDLPGGGPRTLRDPVGVHGVFVNGTRSSTARITRDAQGPGPVARPLPAGWPGADPQRGGVTRLFGDVSVVRARRDLHRFRQVDVLASEAKQSEAAALVGSDCFVARGRSSQ